MDGSGGFLLSLQYNPHRTLRVSVSPDYNRLPNPTNDHLINKTWTQKITANPTLFNGTKFRLASITTTSDAATLNLGITDYKTFQGTHSNSGFTRDQKSLPLGNVAIVETLDGYAPLLVRNNNVGEGKGFVVFPGGHPEPSELSKELFECKEAEVLKELFDSVRREVIEELFLDMSDLGEVTFLGAVERAKDGKSVIVCYLKVHVTKEHVEARFKNGNVGEESDSVIFVKMDELAELKSGVKGRVMMPDHLGAAELWREMVAWKG